MAALAGPLALVAFLLAFGWGLAGVFRDKNRWLAALVTLIAGAILVDAFYRIFT